MTDHKIYAIGDIHGHLSALDILLASIEEDAAGEPYQLIFVGDYIDRGPKSKQVIDRLIELRKKDWKYRPVFLEGNHEYAMKQIINGHDAELLMGWGGFGGRTTFESYGLDPSIIPEADEKGSAVLEHCKDLSKMFANVVGEEHREFLNGLPTYYKTPVYFFCHAGVDFDASLNWQKKEDLLEIRKPFLLSSKKADRIIVHGHTITKSFKPEIYPNRIAIDTGVFLPWGALTACVLQGSDAPRFLMTNDRHALQYP